MSGTAPFRFGLIWLFAPLLFGSIVCSVAVSDRFAWLVAMVIAIGASVAFGAVIWIMGIRRKSENVAATGCFAILFAVALILYLAFRMGPR